MADTDASAAPAAADRADPDRRVEPPPTPVPRMPAVVVLLSVVALILSGAALRATQWITMPLAFAFFAALVFWPIHAGVKKILPGWLDWLAHVAVGLSIVVVVGVFLGSLWFAAERIGDKAPEIGGDIEAFWQSQAVQHLTQIPDKIADGGQENGGSGAPDRSGDLDQGQDQGEEGAGMLSRDRVVSVLSSGTIAVANSLTQALAVFTLVLFFTILMLAEVPALARKTITATGGDEQRAWYHAMVVVSQRVRWYLVARTLLGAATGLLYAGWLWLFDVELLIVWFLLTLLLSFIPTLGSLLSGLLPIVYALITKDLATAVFVGLGILVIEQVMGNFIDPRILGRRLSLSPLVLLFSLVFWGYIWGIVGALLAAPMTVLLTVMLTQWRPTVPFALLLSDETDYEGLVKSVEPK